MLRIYKGWFIYPDKAIKYRASGDLFIYGNPFETMSEINRMERHV